MAVELSIIIVNWNGGELLRRCIASIARFPPRISYEIIVVDNASSDDSVAWLRAPGADLQLIENKENLGFSKANNQAIGHSTAPLLFLLNNDAEVTVGAIDRLVETVRSDERIGACGPRLINPDGSLQTSVWRNPPVAWEILLSGLRLYRLLPARVRGELLLGSHWDHARRRRVPFLSGAAVLVKREMINAVGGLDEGFHMYNEDVEWCLRMVRGGWRLMFEPEAVVMHHGAQSSLKRWGDLERERVRLHAALRFQEMSLPWWQTNANVAAHCVVLLAERAWRRMRGRAADEVEMQLESYLRYLKQSLRNGKSSLLRRTFRHE